MLLWEEAWRRVWDVLYSETGGCYEVQNIGYGSDERVIWRGNWSNFAVWGWGKWDILSACLSILFSCGTFSPLLKLYCIYLTQGSPSQKRPYLYVFNDHIEVLPIYKKTSNLRAWRCFYSFAICQGDVPTCHVTTRAMFFSIKMDKTNRYQKSVFSSDFSSYTWKVLTGGCYKLRNYSGT